MLKSSPQSWPSRIVARWKAATRTTQTTPRSTPLVEPPARPVVARQRRSAARAPAVTSYAPARAVLRPDVLRRDGRVRDLAALGVELEDLRRPQGEVAEQHHLRQGPGVIGEVRARRRTTLASRDPLGVYALGAWVLLLGRMRRDVRHARLVQELRVLAVDPGDQLALVADPQLAARVERPGERIGDLLRPGRVQAAVAPHDLHL